MAKVLSILETAYRATLEEQDDTIVWVNTLLNKGGMDISLLFRSNAVNYLVKNQDASGLSIAGTPQGHPPTIEKDVLDLIEKGVPVHAIYEDLKQRGISPDDDLINGVKLMKNNEIADLFDSHDHVWHW